jgi:hypothetical protein
VRRVVSVSLGSSRRDHRVELELWGEKWEVSRRGTDGDIRKAQALIAELDGTVDAIGLGGIDLYLVARGRRYVIRDALRLARAAKKTPVVDGSGLKDTLERRAVRWLEEKDIFHFREKRVLLVSAVDRFGMAEELARLGARLTMGDLIFAFGLPLPIRSFFTLNVLAFLLLPVICRLPFTLLYPTGKAQEETKPRSLQSRYYLGADVIAGDFHFIRRYLPERLPGRVILTNTVTSADIELLRSRGLRLLVTTTPELGGRSFGANVMEALLVAASGRRPEELGRRDYERLLDELGFTPRVEVLASPA